MQPYPLVQTKLHIPPVRPELVSRPRLIERLNAGLDRKLTLLSAPAGFGKTTLVTQWLKSAQCPVAWLSLDEGDNNPARFLAYVIAALRVLAQSVDGTSGVEGPVLSAAEGTEPRREYAAQREPVGYRQGPVGLGEQGALSALQSAGGADATTPAPAEAVLSTLINEIATIPVRIVLVLDDYHLIEARPVQDALSFLLRRLPPPPGGMHLVIATREDPPLPLARLRSRGQLTELRVTDMRFTASEAAEFLNQAMGLGLSAGDIAALEARTEGWIAGLHLAALALQGLALQGTISMQGHKDTSSFIKSFTGSHRYVLDYLVEEVLEQQSERVQTFLLRTSILDRLCGPLCDAVCSAGTAVVGRGAGRPPSPAASGQETLETLERANLFIVPLDDERRWYRYHHLFAGFLRQRLLQQLHQSAASSTGDEGRGVAEYHIRASQWYEDNGLELEAFQHAAAANDVERAARLMEGGGMPLHFRGAVAPVLNWLASLPRTVLDARPSLWVMYASALSMTGQTTGVEEKLQAAEAAIAEAAAAKAAIAEAAGAEAALAAAAPQGAEPVPSTVEGPDAKTRNLIGHIAAIRALLAAAQYRVDAIIAQSRRALEYLDPDNLPVRTATVWKMGIAYQLQGDRAAAGQAYSEAIAISEASGNTIINLSARTGLGNIQEAETQLHLAAETYRRVLQLAGDPPQMAACEAHLGLARIFYEWNDLDAAQQYAQQCVQLARQIEIIDSFVACEVFLARLKLAQGDAAGAAAMLAQAGQVARQHNFMRQIPEVAAAQVLALLRQGPLIHQGNLAAAADLAENHKLPLSQARVHLAQGDASAALAVLEPFRRQVEQKGWQDERLKVMVLQAVALQAAAVEADGQKEEVVQVLGEALALAEPGGFIRTFVDEGLPMAQLLSEAAARGMMPDYTAKLLAAFEVEEQKREDKSYRLAAQPLVEPLSQRELEVLQLIAQGLSNREISERLFLALDTVKGHNRRIYGKLQVKRRTEAVARARELGLL